MTPNDKKKRDAEIAKLFSVQKPIIGMIHALPTPGSPRGRFCNVQEIYDHGVEEARRLKEGGVDALLIENAGDVPFQRPEEIGFETVSAMSVLGHLIVKETGLPVGFNIVANAAKASLACAKASGASFIRVNQWANAYVANEGLLNGAAADALRYRALLDGEDIAVLADVHVKHGAHAIVADRPVAEQARDVAFFQADVAIATGLRTGHPASVEEIEEVKEGSGLRTIVGSGLTFENAKNILTAADGAIVGVSLKPSGKMWDKTEVTRVKRLMDAVAVFR